MFTLLQVAFDYSFIQLNQFRYARDLKAPCILPELNVRKTNVNEITWLSSLSNTRQCQSAGGLIWRLSHPLEAVSFWTGLDFDPYWAER